MPPTTYVNWHCTHCSYEHLATKHTYFRPNRCPICDEQTIKVGYPLLPTNNACCDLYPKQYDLCGGEKEIQVYLAAATGERAGMSMRPDLVPDCDDDPIAVAKAVLDICNTKYLICSAKPRIEKVLAAMQACEALSEANKKKNRLNELRKRIVLDSEEYENLTRKETRP